MNAEQALKARGALAQVLSGRLEQLGSEDKKRLSARLSEMRTYAIGRHDYYDRLRTQLVAVAAALLPLSVAVATFFYNTARVQQSLPTQVKIGVGLACGSMLVAAAQVLLRFMLGFSPRFAYRKAADILSWYYAYTPTPAFTEEGFMGENEAGRAQAEFLKALQHYGQEWIESSSTIDRTILEDIEQVFILFGLQRYRRDETRVYAVTFGSWLMIAIVGIVIAGLALA